MREIIGKRISHSSLIAESFGSNNGHVFAQNDAEGKSVFRLSGNAARRRPGKETQFAWDGELAGFGLRIAPSGKRTWVVKYRERGRLRYETLGHPPQMDARAARVQARQRLAAARLDGLPVKPAPHPGDQLTLGAFAPVFLEHLRGHWKPATFARNKDAVERNLLPFFAGLELARIVRSDVMRWRDAMAAKPAIFNRAIPVLSALLQHAELMGYRRRGSNAARGIPRYRRKRPERYLSHGEYRRLGAALQCAQEQWPVLVAVLRLLLYTGARVSEITDLRWEWIKPPRIFLPDSKTGPKVIFLCQQAQAVIDALPAPQANGLVFRSARSADKPYRPYNHWHALRLRAGLGDVRLHDLRHSYASIAIRDGISLVLIGKLLGHALPETTERYAHLADDVVSDTARRVSDTIAAKAGIGA